MEIKFRDERRLLPSPELIHEGNREVVSPVIEGRMYEIKRYVDSENEAWAVKTLKDNVNERFYPKMDLESVFDLHVEEHELFMKHLEEFTLPGEFYKQIDPEDKIYFCVVQPWIEGAMQYKEAIKNKREVPAWQLGDVEKRIRFIEGLIGLMSESGKLPDLDFALVVNRNETEIKIFDTSYLYFERREGRDRANLAHELSGFLFTQEELENNTAVKGLVERLAND